MKLWCAACKTRTEHVVETDPRETNQSLQYCCTACGFWRGPVAKRRKLDQDGGGGMKYPIPGSPFDEPLAARANSADPDGIENDVREPEDSPFEAVSLGIVILLSSVGGATIGAVAIWLLRWW